MKTKLTAAIAAAALMGTAMFAHAAEAEGVVASVDAETRTIMLEDGSTWTAADDVDLSAVAAGDTIQVTYEDGTTEVTGVTVVE